MRQWAEARANDGRYSSPSDYVRDPIRRDQVRIEKIAAMNRAIEERLASGIGGRTFDEIIADARERAIGRAAA